MLIAKDLIGTCGNMITNYTVEVFDEPDAHFKRSDEVIEYCGDREVIEWETWEDGYLQHLHICVERD